MGISVYREPVDRNAVLFQAGPPDPAGENIPDRNAASQRITDILAGAGIPVDSSLDLSSVPAPVRELLAPHLQELDRLPVPPFTEPPGLAGQLAACEAASLLHADQDGQDLRGAVFLASDCPARGRRVQAALPGVAARWLRQPGRTAAHRGSGTCENDGPGQDHACPAQ